MRKVLFLFMLFVCTYTLAQRIDKPGEPYDYFCIVFMGNWSKAYVSMPSYSNVHAIMDENDKKKSFNNDAEILTYMSKNGWQYVESIKYDKYSAYLMKKTVNTDEEAKGSLILELDVEQKKKD